ncbi:hypothetical protein RR46_13903 [Papilio xuthus]|uniref:Uncharacterized protein n=1 Tax=Papilio xuthus TaxID=66420 RepID=A0A194PH99_PAPXU|nr:hypothetical protein RR46_13903 [Papilio xuthus]
MPVGLFVFQVTVDGAVLIATQQPMHECHQYMDLSLGHLVGEGLPALVFEASAMDMVQRVLLALDGILDP